MNCLTKSKKSSDFFSGIVFYIIVLNQVVGYNNHHLGLYTGKISSYELVAPKKILSNGIETDIGMESNEKRTKRDIAGNEKLLIRLPLSGKIETLELWPSYGFVTENLVIQNKRHYSSFFFPYKKSTFCHYRGVIHGQPESSVAVSLCNGLVGYLKTSYGDFWIEPSKNKTALKTARAHLVFRRNAVGQLFSKRKRKKRKKKNGRLCGTREPPHIKESRLEWNQKPGLIKVQGRDHKLSDSKTSYYHYGKRRLSRSLSKEQYVETLVVADSSMLDFYQGEDIEMYLLSIMNMVNVMYQDPSIGNYINIVVVRIILLDDEKQQGLNITVNADKTLDSFCRWQKSLNKPDEHDPQHHDVAILITRHDICSGSDTPCSTLGVAHVAGMCTPDKSCSVNEDNGITLAHTIAHELGHNFGMYHDSKKIGCSGRDGSTLHVMTSSFEADTLHIAWSPCSRRDITNFLDGGYGSCLDDKPTNQMPLIYPELPVGIMYNAEYQCKMHFGIDNSSVCVPLDEICSRLWCLVDNVCTTMLYPAAPGTTCGKHRWCEQQKCVGMEDKSKIPVDGSWGKWSEWSECSRTCGAGVSVTKRLCDHPPPSNGGKYCLGLRMRYRICNVQDCPEPSVSFRAVQCSSFNDKTVGGKSQITWLPYYETTEPCQLYCTDEDDTIIMPMGVPVRDGTSCNLGTRDMCISGLCRKVGCDWVVDSDAIEDKCGICRGDGSQCVTVVGFYNKTHGSGYIELISVPRSARNILVEELGYSKNYIGVGSVSSDLFFLNGNKAITLPGEYKIAESEALYTRQKEKEKLHILGPIKEQIRIYLIFQGSFKNPGIRFEYTMPHLNESEKYSYDWGLSDWSACSVTCGGGIQYASAVCKDQKAGVVDAIHCSAKEKPPKSMRVCNLQLCTHRWWTGPWQICPVTCGDLALRSRTVLCVTNDDYQIALLDSECKDQPRPHHEEPCINTPSCLTPTYLFSNKSSHHYITNRNKKKKLNFRAKSEQKSKDKWIVLPWSQCSVTCGLGFKKRTVYSLKTEMFNFKSKPIEMKQCFKKC